MLYDVASGLGCAALSIVGGAFIGKCCGNTKKGAALGALSAGGSVITYLGLQQLGYSDEVYEFLRGTNLDFEAVKYSIDRLGGNLNQGVEYMLSTVTNLTSGTAEVVQNLTNQTLTNGTEVAQNLTNQTLTNGMSNLTRTVLDTCPSGNLSNFTEAFKAVNNHTSGLAEMVVNISDKV